MSEVSDWYMLNAGERIGPLSIDDLRAQLRVLDVYVWRQGMAEWQLASTVPEIVSGWKSPIPAPSSRRSLSLGMIVGIAFVPFIFAWFTLRPGHSHMARIASFAYMFLISIGLVQSARETATVPELARPSQLTTQLAVAQQAVLSPAPTQALDGALERTTRIGKIEIVADGSEQRLHINGKPTSVTDHLLQLGPVYDFNGWEALVIAKTSGGTACGTMFAVLVTDPRQNSATITESFGDCTDFIRVAKGKSRLAMRVGNEAFVASDTGFEKVAIEEIHLDEINEEVRLPITDVDPILNPLSEADMKVYLWCGTIFSAAGPSLTVELTSNRDKFFGVVLNSQGEIESASGREGSQACVTGRYISNIQPFLPVSSVEIPLLTSYHLLIAN